MAVLLTGGAGYIGSHTAVEFLNAGQEVVIADDLSNSSRDVADRIAQITGKTPKFYEINVADADAVEQLFSENEIEAVVHFAGYKAVGESVRKPLMYYRNNIDTALTVLEVMKQHGCHRFVFSSSATVYGVNNPSPYLETMPAGNCTNPYGWTKYMIEQILIDAAAADPELSAVLLRYFNPIGAHESGLIGEKPNGIPNNLMPYITQVAVGKRKELGVFGNDYPTPDGTGVRDYIHVVDLAAAHVAALKCFTQALKHSSNQTFIYNVGTGNGYSVLDMVKAFIRVNGVDVPYSIKPRRAGDIATCYCNPAKAKAELGWVAKYGIDEMVRDSWNWQRQNPDGYPE